MDVQILLATYNSGEYLRPQMDSLLAQDHPDLRILIRDGGSTDGTLAVIDEYQKKFPEKLRFIGAGKATATENFSALLQASDADLVMFCDHDDIWFPAKVSRTLAKYREMATQYGETTPIMVFTDSRVVDDKLVVMDPSMLHFQHLDIRHLALHQLIPQNVVSGNTMLFNRALVSLASPIPVEAVVHDHWITLVAAAFGRIGFLNEATLDYRQHRSNVYGAAHYTLAALLQKAGAGRAKIKQRFEQNIRQAAAFGARYGEKLSPRDREMCAALSRWTQCSFLAKRQIMLRYGIRKCGFWRNLGMFFLV